MTTSGKADEFHIHLDDTDAQFMLAALLRGYPSQMCEALVEIVNRSETERAASMQVELFSSEGGTNNPLDKFCLETAIKLLVAKKSLCHSETEESSPEQETEE